MLAKIIDAKTPPVTGSGILYSLKNPILWFKYLPRNRTNIASISVCLSSNCMNTYFNWSLYLPSLNSSSLVENLSDHVSKRGLTSFSVKTSLFWTSSPTFLSTTIAIV